MSRDYVVGVTLHFELGDKVGTRKVVNPETGGGGGDNMKEGEKISSRTTFHQLEGLNL